MRTKRLFWWVRVLHFSIRDQRWNLWWERRYVTEAEARAEATHQQKQVDRENQTLPRAQANLKRVEVVRR